MKHRETLLRYIAAAEAKLAAYRPENYSEPRHYKRACSVTTNHIKHLQRDLREKESSPPRRK